MPIVVIACNKQQADYHVRHHIFLERHGYDMKKIFIGPVNRLRGLRDFWYIKVGTWWLHPDIEEIEDILKIQEGKEYNADSQN